LGMKLPTNLKLALRVAHAASMGRWLLLEFQSALDSIQHHLCRLPIRFTLQKIPLFCQTSSA
jgi:hypothetical protein